MKHSGKDLKKYGNLKIIDCTKCKFIHIVPLPSKKEISKLYKKKYYTKIKPQYIKKYEQEIDYWNLIFDEKLDYLETKIKRKTKSILDVGSGSGFFLKRAKEKGWTVTGVEPNYFAAKYSEKIGKKIHQKRINLEMNLMVDENRRIKKEIYEKFAEIGIGRTAIIYAKK